MKKILFTSLLCASFAANVNLLPAPPSADETDGRGTGKQAADVSEAPQDTGFLQAPKEIAALISDVQESGFFAGGKNKNLAKLFEQERQITSAQQILFPGSALGKLVEIDFFVKALAENPKETADFATKAHDLTKDFGWKDGTNQSAPTLISYLFVLHKALGAKELNADALISARYQLTEALKSVRVFWENLEELAKAEQKFLAKEIVADLFTKLGSGLTTEDAQLACDKLFEHIHSSKDKKIKEDSLSNALPRKSKDPQVIDLRQKLKKGSDGKEIKIKDIFPEFLNKTLGVSAHKDLSTFFALMPHINKTTLTGQALLNIGYQGYVLQEKQEDEAKALKASQDQLDKEQKELKKKLKVLNAQKAAIEKKPPQPKRK